ncbi:NAD(P)H nitroreductase [Shewanella japonica]|uniref:NAD(P)H nitroreductase n=1 Tax=Shewanella japonica TaxID=93973 RepID=UPI0024944F84|nr:NAD(P)H nitroreductase [Shewanella japonica]
MDASELLLTRQSTPRLTLPAPSESQLDFILNAAARVPDHAALTPWEFIIATGDGLDKLAEAFVEDAIAKNKDGAYIAKAKVMPHRAPMVITVATKQHEHPKVPVLEQHIAAGCATMAMQQAAFSLGLGAVWRTGSFAFSDIVNKALGLNADDQIVGFLYIGTPAVKAPVKPLKPGRQFTRYL